MESNNEDIIDDNENNQLNQNEIANNSSNQTYLNKQNIKKSENLQSDDNDKNVNSVFPYNLDGTISKDGNMTHFVAENIQYKIKDSDSINKRDHQNSLSKNDKPIASCKIDSNVLNDIENEAQYLAASVDNITESLTNTLRSISSITVDNVEIHKNAVHELTNSMDGNIKNMYLLMAKTEELTKSMKPIEQSLQRIRELKRLVDMLVDNL